jgi:hypothetical protein
VPAGEGVDAAEERERDEDHGGKHDEQHGDPSDGAGGDEAGDAGHLGFLSGVGDLYDRTLGACCCRARTRHENCQVRDRRPEPRVGAQQLRAARLPRPSGPSATVRERTAVRAVRGRLLAGQPGNKDLSIRRG